MARYELSDGKSHRFWEITVKGKVLTTRFGRIDSAGRSSTKTLGSLTKAKAEADRLIAQKTKKGYNRVTGSYRKSRSTKAKTTLAERKTVRKKRTMSARSTTKGAGNKKKTKRPKRRIEVTAGESGLTVTHDNCCKFDIQPFVAYIQEIADLWVYDDTDEEREHLESLLNPPANAEEPEHWKTIVKELHDWGFYRRVIECTNKYLEGALDDIELLKHKITAFEHIGAVEEAKELKRNLAQNPGFKPAKQRGYLTWDRLKDGWMTFVRNLVRRLEEEHGEISELSIGWSEMDYWACAFNVYWHANIEGQTVASEEDESLDVPRFSIFPMVALRSFHR